jgi:hypothetical protein
LGGRRRAGDLRAAFSAFLIGGAAGLVDLSTPGLATGVQRLAGGLFLHNRFPPSFGEQQGPENTAHFVFAARLEAA